MIVIIQCAATKQPDAAHLLTATGKPVYFVADPEAAPRDGARVYARPDDLNDTGASWRTMLANYNESPKENPLGLYPAYQLYRNKIYERLVENYKVEAVYILSAGWGLIRADFLTPNYDITFSPSAENFKRRKMTDEYHDFNMLAKTGEVQGELIFFGGRDYLPLLIRLTNTLNTKKVVFFNSASRPQMPGFSVRRFETTTRTNWHYECANAFLDGLLTI